MLARKKMLTCLSVVTVAAITAACSSGSTKAASTDSSGSAADSSSASGPTITIGAVEMLTGSGALYGQAVKDGLEVAVSTLNAKGGLMGQQIKLKVVDNASDNAQTTTLIKAMAADASYGAIIPPTYQPNFNAACAAADAAGLPIVSAQSGPPDPAGNKNGNCFTMTTDPMPQVTFTLKALQAKGITKLDMVYDQDNGYVKFQRPNIEAAAKAAGVTIKEIGVPGGTTAFGPQITKLIDDNPDATFPFFTIEDGARYMKQAKDKGYTGKWFDPVSQLTSRRLPSLSSDAAVGLLASTPQSGGDVASFQAFLDAYKAKTGKDIDDPTYTGFGYDAMLLLAKSMTTAGSTTDRTKIKAALAADTKPCLSICYTLADSGANAGAFLANDFFMVQLTDSGFKPTS
ncbi:MAG: ABC-type branched-chain amino acid transport system, periplasmic component [Pseudonocardiales bacterium]|nr:ABC-type branched-chain amino acid transport system, periplasmic component [Pseudonocardiales bacterium]